MDYTKDSVLIKDLMTQGSNHSWSAEEEDTWPEDATLPGAPSSSNYSEYNATSDFIPYSMRPETYIVPVLFAIIFLIGILGNGCLVGIFVKHRTMRNVPNM